MSEQKTGTSWWQTLPGILTGIAAVITALGGMIAVVYQSGLLRKEVPRSAPASPRDQNHSPVEAAAGTPESPKGNPQTDEPGQVRAGHYAFKLLGTKLEPYSTDKSGKLQKVALRLSIRVTDVMGMTDYVDRRTVRLSVDGAELMPENSINFAVYDRQSVETEAVFIVPADASAIALLLGRPEDAVGRLPLPPNLSARR
jgi:hypothetical protein